MAVRDFLDSNGNFIMNSIVCNSLTTNSISDSSQIVAGSVYSNGYLEIGNTIDNSSQLHFFYGNGTNTGDNYQINAQNDVLQVQYYGATGFVGNSLTCNSDGSVTLSSNGNAYVSNGTSRGQLYDTQFNPAIKKEIYYVGCISAISYSSVPLSATTPAVLYHIGSFDYTPTSATVDLLQLGYDVDVLNGLSGDVSFTFYLSDSSTGSSAWYLNTAIFYSQSSGSSVSNGLAQIYNDITSLHYVNQNGFSDLYLLAIQNSTTSSTFGLGSLTFGLRVSIDNSTIKSVS